jgi:flagellar basal-body rod modification protein FlgD
MTNVSSTTTTTSSTQLSTPGTTYTNPNGLGENDFLMLMMDQLQNQDPLQPSDPSQYMSELAQFTSLEQETSIAGSTSSTAAQQAAGSALELLGHTVSYIDPTTGQTMSGSVSQVDFTGSSGPTLTVGGIAGVALSSITLAS